MLFHLILTTACEMELLFQILRWGNELEELKDSEKETIKGTRSFLPNKSNWIAIWQWGNFSLRIYCEYLIVFIRPKTDYFIFLLNNSVFKANLINAMHFNIWIWPDTCLMVHVSTNFLFQWADFFKQVWK